MQEKEESTCEHCNELEAQNAELRQQIIDLKDANAQLLDQVKQLEMREITTYVDGKYTDDVRICIMDLLSRNVGIRQMEPVMRAVMRLCKINCGRLPQRTAIDDMMIESRSLYLKFN